MDAGAALSEARRRWAGTPAVVTGAGDGLGRAMAEVAAGIGMPVVLADVDADRVAAATQAITDTGGHAVGVVVDVGRYDDVQALADTVFAEFGRVGLLVNNAGIEHLGLLWEEPVEAWRHLVDVNLHGVYHGIRAFVPRMLEDPGEGAVVNVASVAALTTGAYHGRYEVTKHGVLALSEVLAEELRAVGSTLQVSVALPGPVRTRIYGDANLVPPERAEVAERLGGMRTLLADDGMPPVDAACRMLGQVAAGSFVVTTHPDWLRALGVARGQRLLALAEEGGAGADGDGGDGHSSV
jgi:NAD(P)-dependent dehydrogenase (short-subunit alcohol dehydrogenase family)